MVNLNSKKENRSIGHKKHKRHRRFWCEAKYVISPSPCGEDFNNEKKRESVKTNPAVLPLPSQERGLGGEVPDSVADELAKFEDVA